MPRRSSPTVRRRRLSQELVRLRKAAGLTAAQVTEHLDWSAGKLTRMERNEWLRPDPRDIEDLCGHYGADERKRHELVTLAREGKRRGWWSPYKDVISESYTHYIGLEGGAAKIYAFEPQVIPGLLQTAEYARALFRGGSAELGSEEIDRRVEIRASRQKLLTGDDPLGLWAVLDESALRRPIGGEEVMRAQMQHLLEMAELARVTIQMIPFAHGAHAGSRGAFAILKFQDPQDPEVVYVDTPAGELFIEDSEEVGRFQLAFDRLKAAAMSHEDTSEYVDRMMKDAADRKQP